MTVTIRPRADLGRRSTLAIPAQARYLALAKDTKEVDEAISFAKSEKLPLIVLGDGSNVVFGSSNIEAVILKMVSKGLRVITQTKKFTDVQVEAGHDWDAFVRWAIGRSLAGVESLSIVPGTVGAAPVQNVGCYGQEVSETIIEVECFDKRTRKVKRFRNQDCRFNYRDSIFKHPAGKSQIILSTTFRLRPAKLAPVPEYATLQAELARRKITGRPSLRQIRNAVIAVRHSKLPDPAKTPTAGSFFHNAVVPATKYQRLNSEYPGIPYFPVREGKVKIPAAWLVEAAGLRGYYRNGLGMYAKQAVVLVNPGKRPARSVLAFRDYVSRRVEKKFGIRLQMEPELIG